ncbi:SIMPL domain-containing protein [Roseibium sp. M-1]
MTSPFLLPLPVLRKAVLAAGLGAALVSAAPAFAQETVPTGSITMEGRGSISVSPDMAVITASVVTSAKTTDAALSENSAAIAGVIEAIKGSGVEARDIQTSGFGIYPRYDHSKSSSSQPDIVGYEIRNGVSVKVRDLAKLGTLLGLVVENGANAVDSIRFEVSNPEVKLDEARKKAVEDARHKAGVFAAAAGADLGTIVSITETGTEMPRPYMMRAEGMMMAKASDVPIEAGEEQISANVTIRWSLK